ncbi:MAG: divergent polysaccharide deacetylase family protein, partial [Myxococcota bacterium]|nr:divergent polysaccharide deacetylase family protein [Myxococcota bacterium]
PNAQYTPDYVQALQARFSSMLVHLPMEPTEAKHMTIPGYMTMTQTAEERRSILEDALARIPTAIGVNNHMGSRLTADRWIMAELVDALPPHLAVVDSRTSEHSALREAAAAAGRPSGARAVFVDNVQKEDAIFARLKQGFDVAKAYGHAIVIAHPYKESMAGIKDFLHSYGRFVHLVTVERVLRPQGLSPWLRACPGASSLYPTGAEEIARDAP